MMRQPLTSLTFRGLVLLLGVMATPLAAQDSRPYMEIGRASCRERV